MTKLVPIKANTLPDTTPRPGQPIAKQATDYIRQTYVWPVFHAFPGGSTLEPAQYKVLANLYAENLAGFDAQAYPIALSNMVIERESPFRPMAAECRKYLQDAHDRLPHVIAKRRLDAARIAAADLLDSPAKNFHNYDRLCAVRDDLPDDERRAFWRQALKKLADHSVYVAEATAEEASLVWRVTQWWGLKSLSDRPCIIPDDILAEFGLPITPEEIAAARAENDATIQAIKQRQAEAERRLRERLQAERSVLKPLVGFPESPSSVDDVSSEQQEPN